MIGIHDAVAYPFVVDLAGQLARDGGEVTLFWSPQLQGRRETAFEEAAAQGAVLRPVEARHRFEKYRLVRRVLDEIAYGLALARAVRREHIGVLLTTNMPLIGVTIAAVVLRLAGVRIIDWQQDLLARGSRAVLKDRSQVLSFAAGGLLGCVERLLLRISSQTVVICDDFADAIVDHTRSRPIVIPNWAPIAHIPRRSRDNEWARDRSLVGRPVALYAGTLGLKHDSAPLLDLAATMADRGGILVVVSEGPHADVLAATARDRGLEGLVVIPYQPYHALPDVLAAADVLIAVLADDAASFSVPSKVTTYLCAGRPIVAAVHSRNAAAGLVRESGAGIVVEPASLSRAVLELLDDPRRAAAMGAAGRAYAESAFRAEVIAEMFRSVLEPGNTRSETRR